MYDLAENDDFDREMIATYEEVSKLYPRPGVNRPVVSFTLTLFCFEGTVTLENYNFQQFPTSFRRIIGNEYCWKFLKICLKE